ncbi:Rv3654c family TadE-like protein [Kocuria salsicia]|uniref:Rv3654c family TadE-like protein n=1 Tax=Kocuria salsicia TaxID=664639 RepID=UPI0028D07DC6|nr:Rv3654c family TadE-like protein [Kocuria salsicia]
MDPPRVSWGSGAPGGCTRRRRPPSRTTGATVPGREDGAAGAGQPLLARGGQCGACDGGGPHGWHREACGPRPGDPDAGSGTVHGTTMAGALCFLLIALLLVAQAGILTHRAAKAADLSALAAADVARGLSSGIPCDVAARVAEENGAQLADCSVVAPENTSVDVTATIELPQPITGLGPATGVSRAGPPAGEP